MAQRASRATRAERSRGHVRPIVRVGKKTGSTENDLLRSLSHKGGGHKHG